MKVVLKVSMGGFAQAITSKLLVKKTSNHGFGFLLTLDSHKNVKNSMKDLNDEFSVTTLTPALFSSS